MTRNVKTKPYRLLVKNRPGELAKLTRLLADFGINVSSLTVASVGDRAAIQFTTPSEELPPALLEALKG